jgi:hypothetical protein
MIVPDALDAPERRFYADRFVVLIGEGSVFPVPAVALRAGAREPWEIVESL